MSDKPRFPQRLDIQDMPRDKTRALGGLRQALCASFNYCRKYPAKMEVLKGVIVYVHNRIKAFEEEQAEFEEQKRRSAILAVAAQHGIDLDERLSNDKLKAALSDALKEKSKQEAAAAAKQASSDKKDTKKDTSKGDSE